jgi:hypothetical protein
VKSRLICGCLIPVLLVLGGCNSTTRRPPKVIGVRKDAQGRVVQEFVYQDCIVKGAPVPGPHGFTSLVVRSWNECFLREPGKADHPLPFLRDLWINPYECKAVDGGPYWAMMTTDRENAGIYRILAFDDSHVFRNHDLPYEHDWAKGGRVAIYFRDGNRKVIYRTRRGQFEEYDILTDAVKPSKQPTDLTEQEQ